LLRLFIDTVEAWLAANGIGSARLSMGDRCYTIVVPAHLAATAEA
jgi:hypothetical protein